MKLYIYKSQEDMEAGRNAFMSFENVTFESSIELTGLASNTTYWIKLIDDNDETAVLNKNELKTLDMPRNFGYYIVRSEDGEYPIEVYDSNDEKVVCDYFYIFEKTQDNQDIFDSLADSEFESFNTLKELGTRISVANNEPFPSVSSPYCILAELNEYDIAISEIIEP